MTDVETASMVREIAESMLATCGSPLQSVYAYVEAADGWYATDLFDEYSDHLLWRRIPRTIARACYDVWLAADEDKKWKAAEIVVANGKFEYEFHYGDDGWDEEVFPFERMEPLVAARYPGKPIHYPPRDADRDFIPLTLAEDGTLKWADEPDSDQ